MGVQDCEDKTLSNKTSTAQNASLLDIPHEHIIKAGHEVLQEHIIKAGHEVLCDRSPLTSEFEDNPSFVMSPVGIDVHCMKHDDVRNLPLSFAVDLSTVSKCVGGSRRRVTRSMTKMDSSKNYSTQGSLLHDISNLDKANLVDPENLGSSGIPKKDTDDALCNNKAVNVVDCDGMNLLSVGASRCLNTAAGNWELQNSRSYQKGKLSSSCGVKCESKKNISTSDGNLVEQNMKDISSNLSLGCEKGSNEAASCSKDMALRIKSKRKQNDQYVDVTEDLRINLTSQVASSAIDLNDDIVLSRTSMKASRNKKKDAAGKVTSRVDVPDRGGAFNATAAAKQGIMSKEASMTRSNSERKLKSGSSRCELAKSQQIRSPKSAKSTSQLGLRRSTRTSVGKGSEGRYGRANILSPESLSGKKSRSGRVLLPALEFWRNQTVVYDADRQVTGVHEGT